jgi:ATP-dependent Clp protease ATP-binding subunit ClpA
MDWFDSVKELIKKWKAQEPHPPGGFTPRAQQVLALARKEADRLRHNYSGTEHVLLGLIKLGVGHGGGVATNVLEKMGVNLENVRVEVEKLTGVGPDKNTSNIPFTPRVKKVLDFSRREAKALGHTYIGTEHLLLGLLREDHGIAAQVLKNLNINLGQIRLEILKELDPTLAADADIHETKPDLPKDIPTGEAVYPGKIVLNLSPCAIQALAFARHEADRLRHHYIGVEHLLIGLIRVENEIAAKVLKGLGLNLENARAEIEKRTSVGAGEKMVGNIPYTPRTRHVLETATEESKKLDHTYTGTAHLLLGLLQEQDGIVAEVFKNFKIDREQVRQKIYEELKPPGDDDQKKQ